MTLSSRIRVTFRSRRDLLAQQWCPGAELNHRHLHFQCSALPTELPGRRTRRTAGGRARGVIKARFPAVQTSSRRCGRRTIRPQDAARARFICVFSQDRWRDLARGRLEADKVFGLAVSRSRDMAIERAAARSSLLRPRLGHIIRHLSRSRIRDECIIDFVWGMG